MKKLGTWEVRKSERDILHVVPVDDIAEHDADCWSVRGELRFACKCLPYEDDGVIVHQHGLIRMRLKCFTRSPPAAPRQLG
mgnify:CR=1 FL=1